MDVATADESEGDELARLRVTAGEIAHYGALLELWREGRHGAGEIQDRMHQYTTTVTSVGYVTFFGLWYATRDLFDAPSWKHRWAEAALFALVSVAIFVVHEWAQMWGRLIRYERVRRALGDDEPKTIPEATERLRKYLLAMAADSKGATWERWTSIAAMSLGIVAAAILGWGLFAHLVCEA